VIALAAVAALGGLGVGFLLKQLTTDDPPRRAPVVERGGAGPPQRAPLPPRVAQGPRGQVVILADPMAVVTENGRELGTTPYVGEHAAGSHQFLLRAVDGVGTALVILIMIGYYRLSGVLAVAALAVYLLFTLGALSMMEATLTLPGLRWRIVDPADFYYLLMGFAVIAHGLIYVVVTSRLGRAMRAIKLNEPLAQSQGVNPLSYRLLALSLSAALSGVVGGLFVFYLTIIDPSIFDFYYTETMLIMVIMGGPGSFWGVLLSAAVLSAVPDLLRFTTDLRMVLYGVALIAVMLIVPGGLGGWLERRRLARWRRPRAASS